MIKSAVLQKFPAGAVAVLVYLAVSLLVLRQYCQMKLLIADDISFLLCIGCPAVSLGARFIFTYWSPVKGVVTYWAPSVPTPSIPR